MKTNELTGPALDWAVAKCEGWDDGEGYESTKDDWLMVRDGAGRFLGKDSDLAYSTDWPQGGPIIEREGMTIALDGCGWEARHYDGESEPWVLVGPTPLIAAMRCFVASQLGDEVDVPEELRS